MSGRFTQELETELIARNPAVASKLQPGIPEAEIRKELDRAGVKGRIDPLIALYTWRNGTILDTDLAAEPAGFFPGEVFHLIELDRAIGDFELFNEGAEHRPELLPAVGRYFPLFWDGSARWLAVDLDPNAANRVIIVDLQSEEPFTEIFPSFHTFTEKVICANRENKRLVYIRKTS